MKTTGAIKGDAQSETVIVNKTSKIKMRFSNMLACAAVLGYTTAVQIEGENTLDTSAFRWPLSSDAVTLINLVDNQNSIGLKGALEECNKKNGSL